jgi:hypothetical protein
MDSGDGSCFASYRGSLSSIMPDEGLPWIEGNCTPLQRKCASPLQSEPRVRYRLLGALSLLAVQPMRAAELVDVAAPLVPGSR